MGMLGAVEPESPVVVVERHGHVDLIILNRPQALNSVNAELSTMLGQAIEAANQDDEVRVVVLTGEGRAFCAGMDIKAFASGESVAPIGHPEWGFAGVVRHAIDKPIIAAVNGLAFGGGAEIALTADLIVAEEQVEFALPEVNLGLFAAAGGVIRLGQQLPQRIAAELALTGRRLSAREAANWGLVNHVVETGASRRKALELAHEVADKAPLAVQASLRMLRETALESAWTEGPWAKNEREMERVWASQDAIEGARAFSEKRTPVWVGR